MLSTANLCLNAQIRTLRKAHGCINGRSGHEVYESGSVIMRDKEQKDDGR